MIDLCAHCNERPAESENVIYCSACCAAIAARYIRPLDKSVIRFNGGVRCDMEAGPCACGAWHEPWEHEEKPRSV